MKKQTNYPIFNTKDIKISWKLFVTVSLLFCLSSNVFAQDNKCIECHKETTAKKHIHGPTATSCAACHESNGKKHPSTTKEVGFKLFAEGSELCYSCHTEIKEEHNLKFVHEPLKEGQCIKCHEIHSSDSPKFVSASLPGLCLSCHTSHKEGLANAKTVHTASFEGESCLKCHNPHASTIKKLLVDESKTLCLSCHNKKLKKGDRVIMNIEEHLKKNEHNHPALSKSCTACHNPHYSERQLLLQENFPSGNYAKGVTENYSLCFECHDTDLMNAEKTTTGTGFRNGDKNLHFVHVTKEKGRSCVNCHDIHASKNTKLIADKVKFGRWDMPLNFIEKETGGTCLTGCHKERGYSKGDTPLTKE
ncbi:cytochrome c3 family protein [Flavobacterium sp.]|uniref:cytochrome c3 family protein n=1 Tax=Flavobacterium sp. TaxID=239 RepID=UPI003750C625